MQSRFLVDETPIVASHDLMLSSDEDLSRHFSLINNSLNLLSYLPDIHKEANSDELALLRLGIRCFNSGAASLRLLRCGYFQPAMTMVRDLVETCFLLSLFDKEPQSLSDWLSMSEKDRKKYFKPIKVRERLDAIDQFVEQKRRIAYDTLSKNAAHANPDGHHLISPGGMTKIGPFPDYDLLRGGIEELVKYLALTAVTFSHLVKTQEPDALREKAKFISEFESWSKTYFGLQSG